MIELERTYLAKYLPDGLNDCKFKEIIDIYLPTKGYHPTLRIRKNGDKYEITKKEPIDGDPSRQKEETTTLTKEEFEELNQNVVGKRVRKIRHFYPYQDWVAEVDVFQDLLKGLVVVDFEFDSVEEKDSFPMPEFCLVEVTSEVFIAGGMICGKSYEDVEEQLKRFDYRKLN